MAQEAPLRRSCPRCGARALYLEEIGGDMDAVCAVCGFRRVAVVRRRQRNGAAGARQQQLSLPVSAPAD